VGGCTGEEVGEDVLEACAELVVGEREVVVEGLVCVADRELVVEDVRAGGCEHLSELGLRPDGAEEAGAGADDGDRLLAQRVTGVGAGGPVEGVLELPGDRGVVFGGGDEQRVGGLEAARRRSTGGGAASTSRFSEYGGTSARSV
jgi:hypothetical protein